MRLIDVYDEYDLACVVLFQLLRERRPEESISHKAMPTFEDHCAFVASRPYLAWYLIDHAHPAWPSLIVGACYLSKQREVGIAIQKARRGQGHGEAAVRELMRLHPGRFLWNVNPENTASIGLAHKLGFGLRPIQHTYERGE